MELEHIFAHTRLYTEVSVTDLEASELESLTIMKACYKENSNDYEKYIANLDWAP